MRKLSFLMLTMSFLFFSSAQAQFLKKLKQKAEQAVDRATGGNQQTTSTETNSTSSGSSGSSTNTRSGNPTNKGGQGLIATPPDVKENLGTAETTFNQAKYSEARYAVQQAMLGVELQIGQQILKSMPETIVDLAYDPKVDQVTSTGWGWAGLTIKREYNKEDKQMRLSVVNNSGWMQAINLYFNNMGGYAQSTGGQQNWKQTRIKGYRSVIEYNDGSGYKLSVPLGQTSLLVFEGVNYATEQDFMTAANTIDIDAIKTKLGEK